MQDIPLSFLFLMFLGFNANTMPQNKKRSLQGGNASDPTSNKYEKLATNKDLFVDDSYMDIDGLTSDSESKHVSVLILFGSVEFCIL